MVAQPYDFSQKTENQEPKSSDFKWTTVNLQEIFETNYLYCHRFFRPLSKPRL